jgi:hypothetical protein
MGQIDLSMGVDLDQFGLSVNVLVSALSEGWP